MREADEVGPMRYDVLSPVARPLPCGRGSIRSLILSRDREGAVSAGSTKFLAAVSGTVINETAGKPVKVAL
jgi:hypothetical protein